jgi:hypothetical protein
MEKHMKPGHTARIHGYAAITWTCSTDKYMQHHVTWACTCGMAMDMYHGYGHTSGICC